MAITRTQIAKQLLANGGRIGFRVGTGEGKDTSGRDYGGGVGRSDRDSQYGGGNYDSSQNVSGRDRTNFTGRDPTVSLTEDPVTTAQKAREIIALGNRKIGLGDRINFPNVFPTLKAGLNLIKTPQGTFMDQARIDFARALGPKSFQDDRDGGGAQDIPYWAQLGFSSEEEYLASLNKDEEQEPEYVNPLSKLTTRIAGSQFAADGGRIGAQEGGIMPRLNQLGSGVSSAEQMLQDINQRLESAESSLGSDGANQITVMTSAGQPVAPSLNPITQKSFDEMNPAEKLKAAQGRNMQQDIKPVELQNYLNEVIKTKGETDMLYPNIPDRTSALPSLQLAPQGNFQGNLGIPAAGYADGGRITSLEDMDREGFVLGGIAKGLKKAVRGIKKLAKSPIGKAALTFAALKYGGKFGKGLKPKFFGTPGYFNVGSALHGDAFGKAIASTPGILGKLGLTAGGGSMALTGKGVAAAIGIPSILAGLTTPKEDESKFDLDSYYASNKLDPSLSTRMMGSDFDFYGGRIASAEGGSTDKEPVAKKTMPLLDMDGKEMDLREDGGFVPIGRMEKADDVPARLSKNEFVFTADAVRNAGDGDVDKGAEVMYNMMKNLEAGGEVSEESQGLEGARKMFQTSQRLEEVL